MSPLPVRNAKPTDLEKDADIDTPSNLSVGGEVEESPVTPDIGPPPDGGLRAWLTVLGAFLVIFVQFGVINSFGVFQSYYETKLLPGQSASAISWIGGVHQFLLFLAGPFVGRIFDAHGAHILLIPGCSLYAFSLFMMSLCTKYYQFMLTHGVLVGLSSACIFYPAIAVPGQYFAKRRALAMCVAGCSSGLGGALLPIAFDRLFDTMGFAWAMRVVGFISLLLFGIGTVLIRTRLPRKQPTPWNKMLHPFRERPYALLCFSFAVAYWGLYTPFFYVPTKAELLGASTSLSFYCISFINAGSTVGRVVASIGDHWGPINVLITSEIMCAINLLAFWIPLSTVPALIGFSVMYGFFVGSLIAIIPACIAETGPANEIGQRIGMLWAVVSIFALTGPPINGALVSNFSADGSSAGYQYAGIFSGGVAVISTCLGIAAKLATSGGKLFALI